MKIHIDDLEIAGALQPAAPSPRRRIVQVPLTSEDWEALDTAADRAGVKRAVLVRAALRSFGALPPVR